MVRKRKEMRPLGLLAVLVAGAVVMAARVVWVQGLASDRFSDLAAVQRERRFTLAAQRGSIFDRQGSEMAISMDMQTIFANPRFVRDPEAAAEAILPILGGDLPDLTSKLSKDAGFVYLARKAEPSLAEQIRALAIPGIDFAPESKRFYPAGSLASHVIGFVGVDNEGLDGLEKRHERLLRGRPGEVLMERDPQGRPIPAGKSHLVPPMAGHDLVLTIDREIQYVSEEVLARGVERWRAKGGTVIVMRPSSGEILALANAPTFDPNNFGNVAGEVRKNRAVVDVYEPGSANKVITAAAALESGVVSTRDVISVPDQYKLANKVFRDAHSHPTFDLTFAEVIQQSSNVGTIKVAELIGKDRMYEYLRKFGYGVRTGIDISGESPGILPKSEGWWATSLPTISIGQGVAVTPIQMAGVYAAVANAGISVEPKILFATVDPRGDRKETPPTSRRRVIKAETAKTLTEILVGVTQEKNGTGKAAAIPGYEVAGKTGTAQKIRKDGLGYSGYVGSFVGFAPAGNPELVVAVILDEPSPYWGGVTAAPIFKEVMEFSLRHLGIGPGPVLRPPQGGAGTPLPSPVQSGGAGEEAGAID